MHLEEIQSTLRGLGLDGWLLYDFRSSNVLARRILGLDAQAIGSRRFFYFIPVQGEPCKLVHRIEMDALEHLPGRRQVYLKWQELEQDVVGLVAGRRRIAMEYSPRNANPYVSRVDAGTIELVRSAGIEVVSSGDLIQRFEATWDDEQWQMHQQAAVYTRSAYDRAFEFIARKIRSTGQVCESQVQTEIMDHFREHGLSTDHPPIVAVGPHSGDPHYATSPATDSLIREGDLVLIDL